MGLDLDTFCPCLRPFNLLVLVEAVAGSRVFPPSRPPKFNEVDYLKPIIDNILHHSYPSSVKLGPGCIPTFHPHNPEGVAASHPSQGTHLAVE